MINNLKLGLTQAMTLGAVGAALGIVAGWTGLLVGSGVESVSTATAALFPALYVLLPAILLLYTYLSLGAPEGVLYESLPAALATLLTAGLVGGVLAALLFAALATIIQSVFGRMDISLLQQGLTRQSNIVLLIGEMVAGSLLIGVWAYYRARSE